MVLARVVLAVIDPHDDGDVRVVGRSADDYLARPGGQVFGRSLTVAKDPGAFGHHIHAQVAPGEALRIADAGDGHPMAVHLDGILACLDHGIQPAVDRIVLEQMGHGDRVGKVVDAGDLHFRVFKGGPHHQAADPAEAVDTDLEAHFLYFSFGFRYCVCFP